MNALQNGILYLKGGDIKTELQKVKGFKKRVYELSEYFDEPFFETIIGLSRPDFDDTQGNENEFSIFELQKLEIRDYTEISNFYEQANRLVTSAGLFFDEIDGNEFPMDQINDVKRIWNEFDESNLFGFNFFKK